MPRASLGARAGRVTLLLLVAACASPVLHEDPGQRPGVQAADLERPVAAPAGARPWGSAPGRSTVRLPSAATEPVALRAGGVSVGFRLAQARAAVARLLGGEARYEGALGEGTTLRLKKLADGVEDVVEFDRKPREERVDYLLDVRGAAGLRKIGQVVEFLDEQGAPRLRVAAPTVQGADGAVAQAQVELGCAHDESPRAPWGRPVVAPGVDECRMTVRWGGVSYPAALDPVWTSTGSVNEGRAYPGFGKLPDGRFMVAAGRACVSGNCTNLKTAEIYDPATGTWAQTGATNQEHDQTASVFVPGFGLMLIGGNNGPAHKLVEVYLDNTGVWGDLAPLKTAREEAVVRLASDGKTVVVAGGVDTKEKTTIDSFELFDVTSQTWSDGGKLVTARYLAPMVELPGGKFLLAGGAECSGCAPTAAAEIYDPVTKSSEAIDDMIVAHFSHEGALLQVGGKPQVLLAGGGSPACELFDVATKKWSNTGVMASSRVYAGSVVLPDGSLLVAGGAEVPAFEAALFAERYDPVAQLWKKAGTLAGGHIAPAFGLLDDGRFLVATGAKNNFLAGTDTVAGVDLFQAAAAAEPCTQDGECASNHCADGVCCDTSCDGVCEACTAAKKGVGQDGVCGLIPSNEDPDDECAAEEKSTCGFSGVCDGKGGCARYAVNTPCGPATCTQGVSTGLLCTKDAKCQQQVVACAPFLCKDPTACATDCDSDDQCAPTAHCEGKVCVDDLATGAACTRESECQTGKCADGVCCDSDCKGTCQACASALKEGGGPDGVCGPAKADTDPHDNCADEPVVGCDKSGLCDGKGQCALYAAGTPCQPPSCAGDAQLGFRVDTFACDGSGTCTTTEGGECGVAGCELGACKAGCAADGDCAAAGYCEGGKCAARKALGQKCGAARECDSGICVDGVCCSGPCGGPCEACNTPGAPGLCVPVSGDPASGHPACAAAPAGQPCQQRRCDGAVRDSCAAFVGSTPDSKVTCRAAACASGVATLAALCDGKGNCPEVETARCEPFVCGETACKAKCAADSDCDLRFQCDTAKGDCTPRTTAVCDGDHTLINPDGSKSDCAPYRCDGATCKAQCASVLDCVLPNICDEASRTCIPPRPNPSDSGCQAAPGPVGPPGGVLLGVLAGLGVISRGRRRRSPC